jgi:Ca2+-transporting ATPase
MENAEIKQTVDISSHGNVYQGLSLDEVKELRKKYGENRIPEGKKVSIWKILLNQIKSPLVYIILAAAIVSLIMGQTSDFIMIMVVVAIDIVMGFTQEYKAQQTYVALKGLIHPTTTVIRDGQRKEVEVWELVPGDLVVLNVGEKAPADGTLIEATRISMDESILTGESEPVSKKETSKELNQKLSSKKASKDKSHTVYMGTTVVTGRGLMQVGKIGTTTEFGQIAASLSEQQEADTPFQIRIKDFSKTLTKIVVGFTIATFLVGLIRGQEFFEILRISIILAVAAVPEGLLIAVTIIQVLGMKKILKRQGLVKKLAAVETLGSVTSICTDKTGTLTEGQMKVSCTDFADTTSSIQNMVFCNNMEGPVEIALWQYAGQQLNANPQELFSKSKRIAEELFSSETKFMIAGVTGGDFDTSNMFFLKGAPEIVLSMCDIEESSRKKLMAEIDSWADKGLRLIGFACRKGGSVEEREGYTWTGLVGLEDPIRDDVAESIKAAQHAGVKVKIITGDYSRTAERIASSIGLKTGKGRTLEGEEIEAMSDEELQSRVTETTVFARIRPQEKFRIVDALNKNKEVTAMIGDGVNDAPALKRANIGVVVGTATDVAKETADLILLDSHFSTIVSAIEEGRVIFANVQKVVAFMLSNSFAEVLIIFMSIIFNWPAPLLISQILWIHLICDGPSDVILGFEPKENGIMDEKPKSQKEPILTKVGKILIFVISIASAAFGLSVFNHYYRVHQDPAAGRSIVFASLAINSLIYIFAYRSLRVPIIHMNKLSDNKPLIWTVLIGYATIFIAFVIPGLRNALGLVMLSFSQWMLVIGFALCLTLIVEIAKAISNRKTTTTVSSQSAED